MTEPPDDGAHYEYDFDPDRENDTAAAVYRFALEGGTRVLDLGCGPGIVAGALSAAGRSVVGVDADADALERAAARGVQTTFVADLDDDAWVDEVEPHGPFDVVILADVLEHLLEPGATLERVRGERILAPGGRVVVSIPNVAHEAVVANLLLGRFPYTPTGLLDRTHIRFFTRDSFRDLVQRHRFAVRATHRTTRTIEQTELFAAAESLTPEIRRELRDAATESRTYQFVFHLEVDDAAQIAAALRDELDEAKQALIRVREDSRSERRRLESELERVRAETDSRAARLQDDLAAAQRRVDELRAENASLRASRDEQDAARRRIRDENDRLRRKLEDVYRSETWRVGDALLSPVKFVKRRFKGGRRPRSRTSPSPEVPDVDPERPPPPRLSLPLETDTRSRARYQAAARRRRFDPDRRRVVFLCSTTDLEAGRGDLFTAIGLGEGLRPLGYDCRYLAPDDWSPLPDGTEIVVSMLAEPTTILDPATVPSDVRLLAWVRNNTRRWLRDGRLFLYDDVLASSPATRDRLQAALHRPVDLLPIGVDLDLFSAPPEGDRRGVVATINQWGEPRTIYRILDGMEIEFPLAIYGVQRGLSRRLASVAHGSTSFFDLPSVYRGAALVLDDQQSVNAPFGNVNSRIYEALAAGALPITTSGAGLHAVGLDGVPVVGGAEELAEVTSRYLSDHEARSRLVHALAATVRDAHSYERRARTFDAVLGRDRRSDDRTTLAFLPDYRVTNPYQDLLYAAAPDEIDLLPIVGPETLDRPRLHGRRRILHVHWTATILGPATSRADAERRCDVFLDQLRRLRHDGVRIIWTVHNVLPHECAHVDVEIRLRQGLADLAHDIHLLCEQTVDAIAGRYELDGERTFVVEHPSYLGVYPNVVGRREARRALGLDGDRPVLLALGQIRPYKGLERLAASFDRLRRQRPSAALVIAGAAGKFEGVRPLLERLRGLDGVTLVDREIDDDELQLYLAACDVAVLPHRRVLNSGLAMLAFSFARPVVAPDTGCLRGLVTPATGVLFPPEAEDLSEALARGLDLDPAGGRRALEIAQRLEPRAVSAEFFRTLDARAGSALSLSTRGP